MKRYLLPGSYKTYKKAICGPDRGSRHPISKPGKTYIIFPPRGGGGTPFIY